MSLVSLFHHFVGIKGHLIRYATFCLSVNLTLPLCLTSGIMTKAVRKGDEYVINGGKMWTTNGTQADWMCLLANTSDGPPHRNKSLICLPMNLPGRISQFFVDGVIWH